MPILETVVAGLVGTACMTVLMTIVHRTGWANADMIRALGSAVTGSLDRAVRVGLAIHLVVGMLFAFPYVVVLSLLAARVTVVAALLGAVLGLVHGILVSFLLGAVVAERHPLPKFRNAGFEVAVAHVLGHVAYGLGVGVTMGLLKIHWTLGS
jgi:uncharacterized membrane protein YagU involved in acid resistance